MFLNTEYNLLNDRYLCLWCDLQRKSGSAAVSRADHCDPDWYRYNLTSCEYLFVFSGYFKILQTLKETIYEVKYWEKYTEV